MIIKSDFSSCISSQNASPVVPYLSIACVFAFILSFGLGPGNWLFFIKPSVKLLSLINPNPIVASSSALSPARSFERWHHQHPDHRAVHSEDATCSLHNCWLGQLAELFLHQYGVPFHRGEWWLDDVTVKFRCALSFQLAHLHVLNSRLFKSFPWLTSFYWTLL